MSAVSPSLRSGGRQHWSKILSLSQGPAVSSVLTAILEILQPPSHASRASAMATWSPTPWGTATAGQESASSASTTRPASTASAARMASLGTPWPPTLLTSAGVRGWGWVCGAALWWPQGAGGFSSHRAAPWGQAGASWWARFE